MAQRPTLRPRRSCLAALLLVLTVVSAPAPARSQQGNVGDSLDRADTLLLRDHRPEAAMEVYRAILSESPNNVEALWRAARASVVLGILSEDWDTRKSWYRDGADLARQAEALRPGDLELSYWRAANLGRWAQEEPGGRTVVGLAKEVRSTAEEILGRDPTHAGAHNILGMFFFEVLTLNKAERAIASLLAPGTLRGVRWEEADYHLRRAVALDPFNTLYLKDFGKALVWHGDVEEARMYLERALRVPATLPTDPVFQQEARILLAEVAEREGLAPRAP